MTTGQWVLLLALVIAVAFGLYRANADGRFRGTHRVRGVSDTGLAKATPAAVLSHTAYADELGERATLVQFSSAFCAPCRVTRRVLGEIAEATPGVVHIEVDAEHQLDLVRQLGILRTPTTLILNGQGEELSRASGAPTKAQVLSVLDAI